MLNIFNSKKIFTFIILSLLIFSLNSCWKEKTDNTIKENKQTLEKKSKKNTWDTNIKKNAVSYKNSSNGENKVSNDSSSWTLEANIAKNDWEENISTLPKSWRTFNN